MSTDEIFFFFFLDTPRKHRRLRPNPRMHRIVNLLAALLFRFHLMMNKKFLFKVGKSTLFGPLENRVKKAESGFHTWLE